MKQKELIIINLFVIFAIILINNCANQVEQSHGGCLKVTGYSAYTINSLQYLMIKIYDKYPDVPSYTDGSNINLKSIEHTDDNMGQFQYNSDITVYIGYYQDLNHNFAVDETFDIYPYPISIANGETKSITVSYP